MDQNKRTTYGIIAGVVLVACAIFWAIRLTPHTVGKGQMRELWNPMTGERRPIEVSVVVKDGHLDAQTGHWAYTPPGGQLMYMVQPGESFKLPEGFPKPDGQNESQPATPK